MTDLLSVDLQATVREQDGTVAYVAKASFVMDDTRVGPVLRSLYTLLDADIVIVGIPPEKEGDRE